MTSSLLWSLITTQIVMGAFDTFVHHEMTERLAWRPSQYRELKLHAVRNLLYALLFAALGFSEVHGLGALLLIAVLAVELVVTLMDFVEEDMSRKLPASERINHTLLALNYGAILVLIVPVLLDWSRLPTAIVPASYGLWSLVAAGAPVGVAVLGLRDLAAAGRLRRLACTDAKELAEVLSGPQTIPVTGGTGFIGRRRLIAALAGAGHRVIALVRSPAKLDGLTLPITLIDSLDQLPDDTRIDAIVNLAGEPIGNALWTARKREKIMASRLETTAALVRLIARLAERPRVLVSGSAIGWYGLRQDEKLTESDAGSPCFSHDLCDAWEKMASRAERLGVRVVHVRIGLVLGTEGGFLTRMLTPFEFGLGGPFGSGRQWMSWIERDDLIRLIVHALARPELFGPLNATAPAPVTNAEFVAELGRGLRRPAFLRVPAALLRRLAGDFAEELLLGGQRVVPRKVLDSGFQFRHATLRSAFRAILGAR